MPVRELRDPRLGARAMVVAVDAEPVQLCLFSAELDDAFHDLGRSRSRIHFRSPRPRIDGLQTALTVAGQEPVQLPLRQPVLLGRFGHGELLRDDLQDHDPVFRHASDCDLCRET